MLPGDERPAILMQRLWAEPTPPTLLAASLLTGGLVEWVRDADAAVGLGAPRQGFHPNLWQPLQAVQRPLRADARIRYFGARVMTAVAPIAA